MGGADQGAIEGSVTELGGGRLSGANIAIKGPALPAGGGTTAGKDGQYRIDGVPAGSYMVTVSFIGYI